MTTLAGAGGRLAGKVAIVTGGGGGIGREHALMLAREGAGVLVNDLGHRRSADPDAVVTEIESFGGVAWASRTSATWDGAATIVEEALDGFGRVDIVVNNATAARGGDFWRLTEEDWDLAFDVNVKGAYALMREVVPHFARQRSGVIVNTSSSSGFGDPGNAAYASAKESVVGLTRTAAMELARFGIRVNAVRPIAVGSSLGAYLGTVEKWHRLTELATGSRPMAGVSADSHTPAKVASFVTWLCTEGARDVNGQVFAVEGDLLARLGAEVREVEVYRDGGWGLADLDAEAGDALVRGLGNPFALDGHPELQLFEG